MATPLGVSLRTPVISPVASRTTVAGCGHNIVLNISVPSGCDQVTLLTQARNNMPAIRAPSGDDLVIVAGDN